MTLSYKMVTLQVVINNQFKPMNLIDVAEQSFSFLKKSRGLWNEVNSEYKFDQLDNDKLSKWQKYWLSNPIKALTETDPYFVLEENIFKPKFDIKEKHLKSFINLSQEMVDFRFASYIVRGNNDYIVKGDTKKSTNEQLFKSFDKKNTPDLFGWEKFDQMTGYWSGGGNNDYAIYVTLVKSGLQIEHRYHDYFINENTFHWQSKKSTSQDTPEAADLIHHQQRGKNIHLFVRKTNHSAMGTHPFTYCGKVKDIIKVNGNKPIQVEFTIQEKLPKRIKEEFLRI